MKKKTENKLFRLTQKFFQDYLPKQRGLSPNSIISYRDAIKMFIEFVANKKNKKIVNIKLGDFDVKTVFAFLDHLEKARNNNIMTRNQRLAAIRTFFNFFITEVPECSGEFQRIVKIPLKHASKKRIEYLEVAELNAILKNTDVTTKPGQRDYLLLQFLYNTGARVQEVCDLRVKDIIFTPSPSVILTGKGNKSRQTPLWQETYDLLRKHLVNKNIREKPDAFVFTNQKGHKLTRFGVNYIIKARSEAAIPDQPDLAKKKLTAHIFRHTTAMHLLQAGVALNIIQSWLGHVDVQTTNQYVEINMEMKRDALKSINFVTESKDLQTVIDNNRDVIGWLSSLKA